MTLVNLVAAFGLTLAQAQTSLTGTGSSYSATPPDCDSSSIEQAELGADQDATQQCGGEAQRITDYSTGCEVLVHGYAARAHASANYECGTP